MNNKSIKEKLDDKYKQDNDKEAGFVEDLK